MDAAWLKLEDYPGHSARKATEMGTRSESNYTISQLKLALAKVLTSGNLA